MRVDAHDCAIAAGCSPNRLTRGYMFMRYSRSDPAVALLLIVAGIAEMLFGGHQGLMVGSLMLWFVSTVIFPALCGGWLCRHFGQKWGMGIALAPLWLPVALLVFLWLARR